MTWIMNRYLNVLDLKSGIQVKAKSWLQERSSSQMFPVIERMVIESSLYFVNYRAVVKTSLEIKTNQLFDTQTSYWRI